jgi:inhibitor of cysteine peptidase
MLPIDEHSNGRELSLSHPETVELRLKENRTTGFRWTLKSPGSPVCELLDESFSREDKSPGGGGTHCWRLRVTGPGRALVELVYARPWEMEKPARTFKLMVSAGW